MEKLALTEVLRKITLGDVDLDEITEVLRSSELILKSYRNNVEEMHRVEEQLRQELQTEQQAVDDLTRRLSTLHAENRLARDIFLAEIEGRRQILGVSSHLDLDALDMAALIRERETLQLHLGNLCGTNA
jgi:hypothetical protein